MKNNVQRIDFVHSMDELPEGSLLRYPRTAQDDIFNALMDFDEQLEIEANLAGLARHEPNGLDTATDPDHRPILIDARFARTTEDDEAERACDEAWTRLLSHDPRVD